MFEKSSMGGRLGRQNIILIITVIIVSSSSPSSSSPSSSFRHHHYQVKELVQAKHERSAGADSYTVTQLAAGTQHQVAIIIKRASVHPFLKKSWLCESIIICSTVLEVFTLSYPKVKLTCLFNSESEKWKWKCSSYPKVKLTRLFNSFGWRRWLRRGRAGAVRWTPFPVLSFLTKTCVWNQHWVSVKLQLFRNLVFRLWVKLSETFQVVSKTPGPRHLSMITSIGREVFQVLFFTVLLVAINNQQCVHQSWRTPVHLSCTHTPSLQATVHTRWWKKHWRRRK